MMIEQIKRDVEAAHGHFFEPATLRFFRSRVHSPVYSSGQSGQASPHFFVTSEEFVDSRGRSHGRRYTVRTWCESEPGSVDTVGEFQQYATAKAANQAASGWADVSRAAAGVAS